MLSKGDPGTSPQGHGRTATEFKSEGVEGEVVTGLKVGGGKNQRHKKK